MRRSSARASLAALAAIALLAIANARAAPPPPSLLVVLVVDQMRGDYIDRYQHEWTKGLRRLIDEGAWFRRADYPYFNTVTCAGHSTISTGSLPAAHGMVLNSWWDRGSGQSVSCTEDERASPISYGRPVTGGHSAARLLVPTLGDELRAQRSPAPRIVTFSLKARSAIALAGHRADAVTWFDDRGAWVTSTAFTDRPVPFIAEFIRQHPLERDLGKVWIRTEPAGAYVYNDHALGGTSFDTASSAFPHPIGGENKTANPAFYSAWQASPFSDEYMTRLAMAAIESLRLGSTGATDLLGISFSALDKVGHDYGPESHEVQDVLIRLDADLGMLLEKLDRQVGGGNYTVALTADHGVAPIPERVAALGFDAGRIDPPRLVERVEHALSSALGPGTYVAQLVYTDLYFRPGIYDRLLGNPAAMRAAVEALRASPGVSRVYRREDLIDGAAGDAITRAAARSYFGGRSGDLVVLPKAYWITSADATTHGTGYGYDTHVPVILMGKGVAPGEYLQPASPADIAPTLAFLSAVTLSDPFGRVLAEALAPAAARHSPTAAPASRARP